MSRADHRATGYRRFATHVALGGNADAAAAAIARHGWRGDPAALA